MRHSAQSYPARSYVAILIFIARELRVKLYGRLSRKPYGVAIANILRQVSSANSMGLYIIKKL